MKRLEEDQHCPNGPLLIICCNWHNFYITITNIMKDIWNENWRDSNNNFKKRVFLFLKAFLHKLQHKCHAKLDCGSSLLAIYSQLGEMCLYTSLQKQRGPAESLKACQGLGYFQVCRDLTTGVIYPCSLQYLQLLKPASTQNWSFTLSCNLLHFL